MDYRKKAAELVAMMPELNGGMRNRDVNKFSQGECHFLTNLYMHDGCMLSKDIALKTGVSTARITAIINSLEKKGYITRQEVESDRRKVNVCLTKEGRTAISEIYEHVLGDMTDYLTFLGEEDTMQLFHLMERSKEYVMERKKETE